MTNQEQTLVKRKLFVLPGAEESCSHAKKLRASTNSYLGLFLERSDSDNEHSSRLSWTQRISNEKQPANIADSRGDKKVDWSGASSAEMLEERNAIAEQVRSIRGQGVDGYLRRREVLEKTGGAGRNERNGGFSR